MLKPEEILLSRLIPMHDFEREFSYFIRKEVFVRKVPDISPIQVVNKIRPIGNNIWGTGDISLEYRVNVMIIISHCGSETHITN
jgi:hypothetical protein